MKVLPDIYPTDFDAPPANELILPQGLIGFAEYNRAELLYLPDHLPFLWMKLALKPRPKVIWMQLDLRDPAEAMILNIVTLQRQQPVEATVNLIGPLVVNRRTLIGRQLVISNYSRFSAHHSLVENPQAATVARTN